MKKMIMAVVVLISFFLFYGPASATNIGDLEESLRISLHANLLGDCVRPMWILSTSSASASDDDMVNIYITGEMVQSANIIAHKPEDKLPDLLYFAGSLYFDFKGKKVRKDVTEKLKGMIRLHEQNIKLNRETGKDIPSPEYADSYFYGSLVPGGYEWGYSGVPSRKETFDNFRFLTMQITVTLPFSRKDQTYDVAQSNLTIEKRCFHSGKPLKLCKDRKLLTGIVDPGSSLEASGNAGQLFMNVDHDRDVMNKLSPFHRSIFQNVINNIVLLIIKMRDELPVYEFK